MRQGSSVLLRTGAESNARGMAEAANPEPLLAPAAS